MTEELYNTFNKLVQTLKDMKMTVSCAESCTGGQFASYITNIEGSSSVLKYGFVTYHAESKESLVNVNPGIIAEHGIVSAPVAEQMAYGALCAADADIAMGVTGNIGNTTNKEGGYIGDVWLAIAYVCEDMDKTRLLKIVSKNIKLEPLMLPATGHNSNRIASKDYICQEAAAMMLDIFK